MMNLFAKIASTGNKIVLTLMNGNVLEGEITGFGIDYIVLKTNRGTAGIHYNMVGAWEIYLDSNKVQSEGEDEIIYLELEPETDLDENDIEYVQIEDLESHEDDEGEYEDCRFVDVQPEALLGDFNTKVASAKLTLYEPDMSFPLNSLDSENPPEDKKKWDKINSQYQNFMKNRNYSQLFTLASELLKFAEKYLDFGAFHYNAGCFLIHIGNFEQSLSYFEEAFARESLPQYLYNAAYAALKIQDYEKTHVNLAVYFRIVHPMEDPEAWYTFCRLTENELQNSVFRDVLLFFLKDTSKEGRKEVKMINQVNESYIHNSILLSLKSALYFLQKNRKYKEAEPLITFLGEVETGKKSLDREKAFSLLDLSLSGFSGGNLAGYQKLIEILEAYEKGNWNDKSDDESADKKKKNIGINTIRSGEVYESDINNEEFSTVFPQSSSFYKDEYLENESSETLYSKIPRRHGYIFKYIAPKGYGFIRDEKGLNYFFHLSSIIDCSISPTEMNNVCWGTDVHVIFQPTINEQGNVAVQISTYQVLNEMQKLAERYAEGGDYKKAIELSEYVLSIDSDYPISKSSLETWKVRIMEIFEKEQILNDLIEAESNSREGWDSKASFLIENKRYEETLSVLDKVIELTPETVNSLPSGRHLFSFSDIYDSNPEYTKALCKKSFVLRKLGREKEALKIINGALELDPDHSDSLALRASYLLKLDRPQEAHEIIDCLFEQDNDNWELLFLKGKVLLKFHEYKEGLEYFEKALQRSPQNPDILLKYGYTLSKLSRFDAAIKAYDKVINLQPENTIALFNKGFILIMKGEYGKALDLYNSLIQLNPLNTRLWSKKGAILTKMNRSEDALRAVDRALETDPKDAEALFTKGYIYSKIGRDEKSLKYFDQVLELSPFDQKALAKRAFVLSKLGRHSDAFVSIGEALDVSRYNPRTWYYKGFIHYNLEEYDEALFAFNKSAELNPADDRIERMKQFTLVKLGRYEGEMGATAGELLVEEELFDKELQEEYDSAFED